MFRSLLIIFFSSTAAYAAEDGGMPQLDPESWLPQIFWLIITFGILYYIILKIVFPRLSESIEQRNDYVSDLIDEAKKLSEQTEQINKEYNDFILKSKNDAKEIIQNGKNNFQTEFEKKKTQLNEKINNISKKSEEEIKIFKNNSINQIHIIAYQVTNDLLTELSLINDVDKNKIQEKIDEISKKKIGDLN